MNPKWKFLLLILLALVLTAMHQHFRAKETPQKIHFCWDPEVEEPQLSDWFNPEKRPDVIPTTKWHAPVIWEGTYNRQVLEKHYKSLNITIGLAVCTTETSVHHLGRFMRSADQHFMPGHRVIFYLLMEDYSLMPSVALGTLRSLKLFPLRPAEKRESVRLASMKSLKVHLLQQIQHEVDFLFCVQANLTFQKDFGAEALGESVALLHPQWYLQSTREFPYERRRRASAFIPSGKGDFYYQDAMFGGTPQKVLALIAEFIKGSTLDATRGLVSVFESHLNKYFLIHKPTKLLSPEYNRKADVRNPSQIKYASTVPRKGKGKDSLQTGIMGMLPK